VLGLLAMHDVLSLDPCGEEGTRQNILRRILLFILQGKSSLGCVDPASSQSFVLEK
jgi:hypothetical protein